MRIRVRVEIPVGTPKEAEVIRSSLSVDDEGWIREWVEGSTLVAESICDDPHSALRTIDDYLSCLSVAMKTDSLARSRFKIEGSK